MLKKQIREEYDRHRYVLEGDALPQWEKEQYKAILEWKDNDLLYADALKFLSVYLKNS